MKARNFLAGSLLAALTVFTGCHYGAYDDHRDYGSSYDSTYREGYRDGRAAERRRVEPRPGRYSDRGYWRYR
jgi:hypothetical protein